MANNGMRNIWNDKKREAERLQKLRGKKQPAKAENSTEQTVENNEASASGSAEPK